MAGSQCGSTVGARKHFYQKCGRPIFGATARPAPNRAASPSAGSTRPVLVASIGVIILLLAAAGFILFSGPSPAESVMNYVNALLNDNHALARQYMTHANQVYLDARPNGWDARVTRYLLNPFGLAPLHGVRGHGNVSMTEIPNRLTVKASSPQDASFDETVTWSFGNMPRSSLWTGLVLARGQLAHRTSAVERQVFIQMVREGRSWKVFGFATLAGGGSGYQLSLAQMDANVETERRGQEASAERLVRSINVALYAYRSKYHSGYPDTLDKLGYTTSHQSDPSHVGMFSPDLNAMTDYSIGANGFVKGSYTFTYTPGPLTTGSADTYTVTARPLDYSDSEGRSFYSDQSYVIRATRENRPAGPSDPSVN